MADERLSLFNDVVGDWKARSNRAELMDGCTRSDSSIEGRESCPRGQLEKEFFDHLEKEQEAWTVIHTCKIDDSGALAWR